MSFVRAFVVGMVLATSVWALVTFTAPQLEFAPPAADATVKSLRADYSARRDSLEHLGALGWFASRGWLAGIEQDLGRERNKWDIDEGPWLRGRIKTLDGQIARAAKERDRIRYGVFASVLLTLFGAAILGQVQRSDIAPQGRGSLLLLGFGSLVFAVQIPGGSEHTDMLLPIAIFLLVVCGTLLAGIVGASPFARQTPQRAG
jgi:hypothetical protein